MGISKNTAARYMAKDAPFKPKYTRATKLEPYKQKIDALMERGIFNCVVILENLQADGYDGGISILKKYVYPHRPPKIAPDVRRYETEDGRQAQMDWGICIYIDENHISRKVPAFTMILGVPWQYSGRDVQVRLMDSRLENCDGNVMIADHEVKHSASKILYLSGQYKGLMERGGIAYPYPAAIQGMSAVEVQDIFVYDRLIGGYCLWLNWNTPGHVTRYGA